LLENSCFSLRVVPAAGGSVELIATHDVHTFLKTHWYANHVAYGRLFTDVVLVGETRADADAAAYTVVSKRQDADQITVTLASNAGALAPGLRVTKTYAMRQGESAFSLTQRFTNLGREPIRARFGLRYSADPERWSRHYYVRMYCGGAGQVKKVVASCRDQSPTTDRLAVRTGCAWFMSANSYSKTVTALLDPSATPLHIEIAGVPTPAKRVVSGTALVTTEERTLQPGESLDLESKILVGESMPGLGGVTSDGLAFGADVPPFRPPGHPVSMYATIVSPTQRKLRVTFRQRPEASDRWTDVGTETLDASPGRATYARAVSRLTEAGPRVVSIAFTEDGKPLVSLERRMFIGEPGNAPEEAAEMARTWSLKMREFRVAGSWRAIGQKMGQIGKTGLKAKELRASQDEWQAATREKKKRVADAMAFFRKHSPWYLELVEGEAEFLKVPVEQAVLALLPRTKLAKKGCIDFAVPEGPNGPLAAWSNEGYGLPESRCYYLHVQPEDGYTFHAMDGYGVNEKGLATGGAALSEHRVDRDKCMAEVDKWLNSGKFTVPINSAYRGNIAWLLAKCATVKEALEFLHRPEAPVSWTGNMLLVDRSGDAAVYQSCGFKHVTRRPKDGLLTCTNYPGERSKDGGFAYAGSGGQYFNGILRERTISHFMRRLDLRLSVDDAKALLRCRQEPGPVCQSKYDNPAVFITTTSFLANCRTSALHMCWGNPWHTQFVKYELFGTGVRD